MTHGGKRPGAGRPATGRLVRTHSVCLTADELARVLSYAPGPKPSLSASVRRMLEIAEGDAGRARLDPVMVTETQRACDIGAAVYADGGGHPTRLLRGEHVVLRGETVWVLS